RRVPIAGVVPLAGRGEGRDRELASPLQRGTSSLEPRLPHTRRVRNEDRAARRSVATGNGSNHCGMWSLRAPTRCITVPQGANEGSTEGGVLKLSVARRTWAGQRQSFHFNNHRVLAVKSDQANFDWFDAVPVAFQKPIPGLPEWYLTESCAIS